MNEITPDQLDEWSSLCDAATEGPWRQWGGTYTHAVNSGRKRIVGCDSDTETPGIHGYHNARFIAASRTAMPALIAEVRRLHHILGNLLAVIHRDGGHYVAKHGLGKAAEDAESVVCGLRSELDAMTDRYEIAKDMQQTAESRAKEAVQAEVAALRSENARLKAAQGHLQQELAMRPQR